MGHSAWPCHGENGGTRNAVFVRHRAHYRAPTKAGPTNYEQRAH